MNDRRRAGDDAGAPTGGQETDDERRSRDAAERAFVQGLIARGEAAELDEHGKLPPGATHEIVEWREGDLPKLRRRRFS
ncbi:MAG TPA: hypothetical protein VKB25_05210 [Conexibacter sp.]|nr:hypothetical protein [Conexibacter sp.]